MTHRSASIAGTVLGAVLLALAQGCAQGGSVGDPAGEAAAVQGFVRDDAGEPIEGAQVFIADETAGALTDERGAYRIDLPPSATYLVKAVRVGFTRDSLRVPVGVEGSVTRADFVLVDSPVCQGQCFDDLENPIACC
jgi:hypothetical protein